MKRGISLCIILAVVTAAGNAQFFVEGSLAVEYNDATPTFPGHPPEKQFADSYWSVSPLIGYKLYDDFAAGVKANFSRKTDLQRNPYAASGVLVFEKITFQWNLAGFCRYKIWGTEKLSFLVESSIYIGGVGKKEEMTGQHTKKIESRSSFGINVEPLVTYDITGKWSIITSYRLFNLGFRYETVKNEETGLNKKLFSYGLGAASSLSIPNTIGFIYHF